MKRILLLAVLAAATLLPSNPVRADGGYPYQGRANYAFDGTIRHIDGDHKRLTVIGNDGLRYTVDMSDSDIVLPGGNAYGRVSDLAEGQSVHVIGTQLDGDLIEADRVRVFASSATPAQAPTPFTDAHMDYEHITAPADSAPASPVQALQISGLVREVDCDRDHVTIIDGNDHRYTVDTYGSDIFLADSDRPGHTSDLVRGMRVRIMGTALEGGIIAADRVNVEVGGGAAAAAPVAEPAMLAAATIPVLAPVALVSAPPVNTPDLLGPVPAATSFTPADVPNVDLDSFTGILIDCREQPNILRSPSPAICGPDMELLYPDRSHVPTPDEVQDESIVRYYRTLEDAQSGVGGSHPLILMATQVVGPAQDSVQLSAQDMALFQALDQKLHYSRNWKVGFLIPPDK